MSATVQAQLNEITEPKLQHQDTTLHSKEATTPNPKSAPEPAFSIDVKGSDKAATEMLNKHLGLFRFMEVQDLDEEEFKRLMALAEKDARNLLGTMGYFNPSVHITASSPINQHPVVTVNVAEGPHTTIADVDLEFEGNIASTDDPKALAQRYDIVSAWSLQPGALFSQSAWSSAKTEALRTLVAKRYPKGTIAYSLADIEAPENAAHLKLKLDSGPLYQLGDITVKGDERYDPVLAKRLSWLRPGEDYDQKRLIDAQQRLAASGYYSSAYISIDAEGEPSAVPVTIQVREAKRQHLSFGVGYSTDTGPRLTLEHRDNTMPVLGWRAVTKLQANRKTPLAETDWLAIPDEEGWQRAFSAKVDRIDDDSLITTSARVRLGRVKSMENHDRNFYIQYDRSSVKISDDAGGNSSISGNRRGDALMGDGAALSLNYSWTGRYFNNMLSPTQGYGLSFDVGAGTTLLNGNQPFVRMLGRWLAIVPLSNSRLQFHTVAGAVVANNKAAIPASYLFRTGGDSTVRGYSYRSIGIPYDGDITLPGRYMAVGGVEWLRPIFQERFGNLLEQAFFIDVGGVGNKPQDIRAEVGLGTGIRMNSPVGPLALDVAYGVKTKSFRLHMSVGFVF